MFVPQAIRPLVAAACAVLLVGAGYYGYSWHRLPNMDPTDRRQVEKGRRVYAEACASCHGAALEGQPNWRRRLPTGRLPAPPHDVTGHTWEHSDEALFRTVKIGPKAYPPGYQTDMPAFEDKLTDDEIAASLAFIKSTWPPHIRAKQARIVSRRGER